MLHVTKDCEVEVSYEKNGFKGVWYKATLEETPTKSKRKLLRVRYTTSLKQELVDQSLIRPVPPKDMNDGEVFEEGLVVNADCINSWWTGLVVKRKEDDKYLVYFESPPNVIEFERKQLRAHLDWTGWKWARPENKELSKSVFSSGTMVELRRLFDWRPAMIIKEVENGNTFIVKLCDGKFETVDSRIVRPKQPFFSVGEYELLDHVEVFDASVWRDGVVRGIVYEGRYMVSFGKAKVASAQFNYSDLRPPMEWEDGIWHQRPKTKSRKDTPSDFKCYSRKRKRGEADHNSNLNNAVLSSDRAFTVVNKKSAANVEDTQAKDTPIVLPFEKKSPVWKLYEAMEVFRKVPQNPHFSPLIKSTSEDFREGSALGMMASFSGLLEKLKDLETDVTVSQLDSLKDSFTKLGKYGFDVTRPLSRIKKLFALKDRQVNMLEKRKGLDKERMDESSKRRKMLEAALKVCETERKMLEVKDKILELQRQEAALKEQKEAAEEQKKEAYMYIFQMESGARDLDVELEDVEFDFETMLSAPW